MVWCVTRWCAETSTCWIHGWLSTPELTETQSLVGAARCQRCAIIRCWFCFAFCWSFQCVSTISNISKWNKRPLKYGRKSWFTLPDSNHSTHRQHTNQSTSKPINDNSSHHTKIEWLNPYQHNISRHNAKKQAFAQFIWCTLVFDLYKAWFIIHHP